LVKMRELLVNRGDLGRRRFGGTGVLFGDAPE
jgi:hypothetical protein